MNSIKIITQIKIKDYAGVSPSPSKYLMSATNLKRVEIRATMRNEVSVNVVVTVLLRLCCLSTSSAKKDLMTNLKMNYLKKYIITLTGISL